MAEVPGERHWAEAGADGLALAVNLRGGGAGMVLITPWHKLRCKPIWVGAEAAQGPAPNLDKGASKAPNARHHPNH
jgi:hypothetical protein